jgi:hypothetical protein
MNPQREPLLPGFLVLFVSCALVGSGSFVLGGLRTEQRLDRQRTAEETEALAPILASDPAFENVVIQKMSMGGVYLYGKVPMAADLARLRALVVQQLGERWLPWRFSVEVTDRPKLP